MNILMYTPPRNRIYVILGVVFVIVLLALIGWKLYDIQMRYSGENEEDILTEIEPYNEEAEFVATAAGSQNVIEVQMHIFGDSDTQLQQGNMTTAQEGYIALISDPLYGTFNSSLFYRLALTVSDPSEQIQKLKEIADNESFSLDVRSRAIEAMGLAYALEEDLVKKEAVTKEIFRTKPYIHLYKADDIEQSYVRLFEYGSTMKTTALGEVFVAEHYLRQALAEPQYKESHLSRVEFKITVIEQGLAGIKNPVYPRYKEVLSSKLTALKTAYDNAK